jgi:hypothetical protein
MPVPVTINKKRKHAHQSTEVSFTLDEQHKIKVELLGGPMGDLIKTNFNLYVDDEIIFNKSLFTLFIQRIKFIFKVKDINCLIKYYWLSGIWFGHIYLDGEPVV